MFGGRHRSLAKKQKGSLRFVRSVGLGFKTPKSAAEVRSTGPALLGNGLRIRAPWSLGLPCSVAGVATALLSSKLYTVLSLQGTYIDKKCPFTGSVSIRGRILKGVVISTKMARTIVIRRDYLRFVRKYRRYAEICVRSNVESRPLSGCRRCTATMVCNCGALVCSWVCSFEKRHKTLSAHCSPAFRVKEGDVVTVGQCR